LDETGQKHTDKKFVVLLLTEEELQFKISDNLTLDEAAMMLYGCLDYLSRVQGLYEDLDTTVLQ
jgi:hypothetical protein